MFLTFNSETLAQVALNQINERLGCPIDNPETGYKMVSWADIRKSVSSNLWFFTKPGDEYMHEIMGYVEQEFQPEWSPAIEDNV